MLLRTKSMATDNENPDATTTTVIKFRREEFDLYYDDSVRLVDESNRDLIRKLYVAFTTFQCAGVIREIPSERLNDTLYENEYLLADARLVGKSWATMDLNTAGFFIGLTGCLGGDEILALLPFQFEILLRANSWVWPFD